MRSRIPASDRRKDVHAPRNEMTVEWFSPPRRGHIQEVSEEQGAVGMGRAYIRVRLGDIRVTQRARRKVDGDGIGELAASLESCGQLSPLVVRRAEKGWELVAGYRRLKAMELLGWDRADALVLAAGNGEAAVCALVENVQREDLSCFEEAESYRALLEATGMTQEALARRVGKSPSAVANKLRLLKLDPAARAAAERLGLGERQTRALLRLPPREQKRAAEAAAREGLSARQTEELAQRLAEPPQRKKRPRVICLDSRLYVNALMKTVRQIRTAGGLVDSRVEEREEGTVVTVILMGRNAMSGNSILFDNPPGTVV